MLPEFTLFGLTIDTYSLMAVLAAVTCFALSFCPLRRCGLSAAGVCALFLGMCIAFLVGARLLNIAVNPDSYDETRPWYVLKMTGFSLYGGIAGVFLAVLAAAGISRIHLGKLLDTLTIPGAAAFCVARIGCFLSGCCGGKETDLPWGVHPTQLYEMILALLGIPLCLLIVKKARAKEGGLFLIYGVWFSTVRALVLPLRALPYSPLVTNIVYPLLYYVLIVLGVFLFVWSCRKGRKEADG